MKIVIAGAGAIGYHLAKLLSQENQDITLIDSEEEVLEKVAEKLDVMTILGDAASIDILRQANVKEANLFIAVTTSEKTNLLTAILAKQKGAKKTIARVNNTEYLSKEQRKYFANIGIDTIISPHQLVANEIQRLIKRASLTDIFEFEDGMLSIVGFTIDSNSKLAGKSISQINEGKQEFEYRAVALLREHRTIIPRGSTLLSKGDHVYLSIASKNIDLVMPFLGKQINPIKRIMIIGDTPLALKTAECLENNYKITMVMKSKERGKKFLKTLKNTLVIIDDPGNKDILEQEGLEYMDAFIALTPDAEINILSSLVAESSGVYKTIALVDNEMYTHISQNIGVDTIINKKLVAANNIFRFVRKGNVHAIATLHGVDAEIIEFEIEHESKLTKEAIGNLNLPIKSIIAGVIRGRRSLLPSGDFVMQKGDKVIIFVLPEAISAVEDIFK